MAEAAIRVDSDVPERRRSLVALFATSIAILVLVLGVGSIALLRASASIRSSENARILVENNARVLPQTSRELQHLVIDLQASPIDLTTLARHRSFVAQRVEEAQSERAKRAMMSDELVQRVAELGDTWRTDIEPRIATVTRGRALTADDRAKLIADITDLELEYNDTSNQSEIARRTVGAGLLDDETASARDSRALMILLGILVGSSSLFAAITAGAIWRLGTRAANSARRLRIVNQELQTVSQVAERTQNLVLILSPTGVVEWSNEAFRRRTGFSQSEVEGKPYVSLLCRDCSETETSIDELTGMLDDHAEFTCEVHNLCADGSRFLAQVEHRVVSDGGAVVHTIVIGTDISEQRQTETLLIEAKEAAEDAAHAKSGFLATMSHEIRTPLNAVIGMSELLMGTDLSAEQREYADVSRSSGKLLLSIVNDILTFSALEADGTHLGSEPFDLRLVLSEAVQMLQPRARAKSLALEVDIEPQGSIWLMGDANRISQIVVNLLTNAVKFTDQGWIRVSAVTDSSATTVTVSDSGIGIPKRRQGELFKPFSQVDTSTTRRHGGTGLGLAISSQLVSAMNGTIELTSEEGEGTTVVVSLPLRPAAAVIVESATPSDQQNTGQEDDSQNFSTLRVLVAEDGPVNRRVALRLLQRLDVTATTVTDGQAAVAAVTAAMDGNEPFDLVLMDVHMPVLDGVDAAHEIRALMGASAPRIVALTANALPGDRERLIEAGMDDYLAKPVSLAELSSALRRALRASVAAG